MRQLRKGGLGKQMMCDNYAKAVLNKKSTNRDDLSNVASDAESIGGSGRERARGSRRSKSWDCTPILPGGKSERKTRTRGRFQSATSRFMAAGALMISIVSVFLSPTSTSLYTSTHNNNIGGLASTHSFADSRTSWQYSTTESQQALEPASSFSFIQGVAAAITNNIYCFETFVENIQLDGVPNQNVRAKIRAQHGRVRPSNGTWIDGSLSIRELRFAHADGFGLFDDTTLGMEIAGRRELVNMVLGNLTYERCGDYAGEAKNPYSGYDTVAVSYGSCDSDP